MSMPTALTSYIATRDKALHKKGHFQADALTRNWQQLEKFGTVEVGGRASCGGKPDLSWVEFCAWQEIVKKAQQLGIAITVTRKIFGNGWATKAQGFWDANVYTLGHAARLKAPTGVWFSCLIQQSVPKRSDNKSQRYCGVA